MGNDLISLSWSGQPVYVVPKPIHNKFTTALVLHSAKRHIPETFSGKEGTRR